MCQLSYRNAARRFGGFTLLELLGAVALLGVLLAIALPSYMSYRDKLRSRQATLDIVTMSAIIQGSLADAGSLPADLSVVSLNGRLDPWGRTYVYYNVAANGRGGSRKDRALNPINTDFDLYSLGPDGQTKPQVTQKDSVDDIIRANNGGFFGVAATF